ncbi:unnamed protein product, partial [Prorocentrum cordatum]
MRGRALPAAALPSRGSPLERAPEGARPALPPRQPGSRRRGAHWPHARLLAPEPWALHTAATSDDDGDGDDDDDDDDGGGGDDDVDDDGDGD